MASNDLQHPCNKSWLFASRVRAGQTLEQSDLAYITHVAIGRERTDFFDLEIDMGDLAVASPAPFLQDVTEDACPHQQGISADRLIMTDLSSRLL